MKRILAFSLLFACSTCMAMPNIADILKLNKSLVQVSTKISDAETGRGSGVVVSKEYVATNCHVIANTKGASISKYRKAYQPIAFKADWKHDLCLLQFKELPFDVAPMRDSSSLEYEEDVITLGYPVGFNVPQPSYGQIKGTYAYDGSNIIRTNAAFGLGSSGGALFDKHFNLIGISTFKSPGKQGFYYNLPVEWIKQLMASPESHSLKTLEVPFWALPQEKKPYFMQVVIPYQNHEWGVLKMIAEKWVSTESTAADAWYFLGLAEEGMNNFSSAEKHFNHAFSLNQRDLDALLGLSRLAYAKKDISTLKQLKQKIDPISKLEGDAISEQIASLKAIN